MVNRMRIKVSIKGLTPLLMDRFTDKAKDAILAKDFGYSRTKKQKLRNKEQELSEATHMDEKGKPCFPIEGFKKGMMGVTSFIGDRKFTKKLVTGSVFIIPDCVDQDGAPCVYIDSKIQTELKHWIEHNVKFSPMFNDWTCSLTIEYIPDNITADDIVTCLQTSGRMVGVGGWRPQCKNGGSGVYGQYTVLEVKEVDPKTYI